MNLTYVNNVFVLRCPFEMRHIPKENGFKWDPATKAWYTRDQSVAARLREFAIGDAETRLTQSLIQISPWTSSLPSPPLGLRLLPHQEEAIQFSLSRTSSYLGLDPGLGKTICAAVISLAVGGPIVYISPPFLLLNVVSEFKKWAPRLRVGVLSSTTQSWRGELDVLLVSDSILHRDNVSDIIRRFSAIDKGLVIVDEAHRFKSPDTKRTKALFGDGKKVQGLVSLFKRRVMMSGTPMPNRPIELFPVLSALAAETISNMSQFQYGLKFCGGKRGDFGWDFTGATNMAELRQRVVAPYGPFMLRLKKDLLDLPEKLEEVLVVSSHMSPRLAEMNRGLGERYSDIEDLMKDRLAVSVGKDSDELHVATYRRLLGEEKVKATIEYVKTVLEETSESILLFAYHKSVVQKLFEGFDTYKPYLITGDTPVGDRHALVNDFQQSGTTRRLFIGNYLACGVGFTLTKATRVIFCEFDWVPGTNEQAGDRAHRIGQKSSVLVQYVVYQDSLDKAVVETLLRKRRAIQYV